MIDSVSGSKMTNPTYQRTNVHTAASKIENPVPEDDRVAHCALMFVLFGVIGVLTAGVASALSAG